MGGFYREVLKLCKRIPRGKVTTYKAIAEALGSKAYRAVGTALRKNPDVPRVPCHRVVKIDGSVGNYAGSKDNRKKIELLRKEGVEVRDGKINKRYFYYF